MYVDLIGNTTVVHVDGLFLNFEILLTILVNIYINKKDPKRYILYFKKYMYNVYIRVVHLLQRDFSKK